MKSIKHQIKQILDQQDLAVLSTFNPEFQQPYVTIIAFYHSNDLKNIFFATPKATRKYHNLMKFSNVSLLIDTRKNNGADIGVSSAVTVIGIAEEMDKDNENILAFINKHQQLESFIKSPSTAFFCIKVKKYILVNRFQDVSEMDIN